MPEIAMNGRGLITKTYAAGRTLTTIPLSMDACRSSATASAGREISRLYLRTRNIAGAYVTHEDVLEAKISNYIDNINKTTYTLVIICINIYYYCIRFDGTVVSRMFLQGRST